MNSAFVMCFLKLSVSHFIEVVNTEESFTGSTSKTPSTSRGDDQIFFSSLEQTASKTVGGKASLQPKRTPLSNEEIEAILVMEPIPIWWLLALIIADRSVVSYNAMCFKHSIWTLLFAREANKSP